MAQAYSNPKREPDPWALPDIEVWEDHISEVYCRCGVCEVPRSHADALGPSEPFRCPSCERPADSIKHTKRTGWFYWYCFPGCLPDSDCFGPYDSEEAALDAAREDVPRRRLRRLVASRPLARFAEQGAVIRHRGRVQCQTR